MFSKYKSLLNGNLIIPDGYKPFLDIKETEKAIKYVKDSFQNKFSKRLNLSRVSAPMIVLSDTGINDHLNGTEKPVNFPIKDINQQAEIVQSLAKWKRLALAEYGFTNGEGLYTDMNALRPDETLDNLHSIYVDQWDWEKVIHLEDRNVKFLKSIVKNIYEVIKEEEIETCAQYNQIPAPYLPDEIFFIHSEELEEMYPELSPRQRETEICKNKKAVFIIGIGADLKNGQPHDGRASDYDDWTTVSENGRKGLNGDIIVWNPILNNAYELSSMGIRVNEVSLLKQLVKRNENFKKDLYFHKRLLNGTLPLSMGGGIGQSRLCMLFLRKAHVGEVQSSIWSDEMIKKCKENNINLL